MNQTRKKIVNVLIFGLLLSSTSIVFGEETKPSSTTSNNVYVGIFGGEAKMNNTDFSQSGTVYFTEAVGGPLAVNATGQSNSDSTKMFGAHIGFAWPNDTNAFLPISPAIEVEGYSMNDITIKGNAINDNTTRLPEHDFSVSYPLKTDVFLINAVLSTNSSFSEKFTPYIGIGLGSALESISNATSTQIDPPESGINHYNSDPDDKTVAFAVQPKVGMRFNINSHLRVFAEYRYLYISETDYTFGSTVDPTHAETSPWKVEIDPQHYNMGVLGVELSF